MRKTVAQLMSVDFLTVTVRMSLSEALSLLVNSDATELCVVDEHGHFEGIVSDFDLLKSQLNGEIERQTVGSLISRAVTVLASDVCIDQAMPLFRDGSCSRAYICRNGRLLGRLSRTNVLSHLTQLNTTPAPSREQPVVSRQPLHQHSAIDSREPTPPAPQLIAAATRSVLGMVCGQSGTQHAR